MTTKQTQSIVLRIVLVMAIVSGISACRKKPDTDMENTVVDKTGTETPTTSPETKKIVWLTAFEQAKIAAAREEKDIFMNFSGSDWCSWCIRLDKEVFSQDYFAAEAPKHFVLVNFDFPNDSAKIDAQTRRRNETLAEQFGVDGFPTIILADSNGREYNRTGYIEGGAENYIAELLKLKNAKGRRR